MFSALVFLFHARFVPVWMRSWCISCDRLCDLWGHLEFLEQPVLFYSATQGCVCSLMESTMTSGHLKRLLAVILCLYKIAGQGRFSDLSSSVCMQRWIHFNGTAGPWRSCCKFLIFIFCLFSLSVLAFSPQWHIKATNKTLFSATVNVSHGPSP